MSEKKYRVNNLLVGAQQRPLKKWLDYLEEFMLCYELFAPSGRAVVALSGGVDSRALVLMLVALRARGHLNQICAVYVDHGWREESKTEARELKKWTLQLDVEFWAEKVRESFKEQTSNKEARARDERYKILRKFLLPGDYLYLGHHLDDSYEWHLLQSFRSSQIEGSFGIALKNSTNSKAIIARPLMCFARHQLEIFLSLLGQRDLAFEDFTNFDTSFERNWLRQELIPQIKKRHPNYLKNYVQRMNALVELKGFPQRVYSYWDPRGGLVLEMDKLLTQVRRSSQKAVFIKSLREHIHRLSKESRGQLRDQLDKCYLAYTKRDWAEFSFSGGVKAFCFSGFVFLVNSPALEKWYLWDKSLSKDLNNGASQIPWAGEKIKIKQIGPLRDQNQAFFPFILIVSWKSLGSSSERSLRLKWSKKLSKLGGRRVVTKSFPFFDRYAQKDSEIVWVGSDSKFFYFLNSLNSFQVSELNNLVNLSYLNVSY